MSVNERGQIPAMVSILCGSIGCREWLGDLEDRFCVLDGICAPKVEFWELVPTVAVVMW